MRRHQIFLQRFPLEGHKSHGASLVFTGSHGNHGLKIALLIETAVGPLFGTPVDVCEMCIFLVQLVVMASWPGPAFKRAAEDQLCSILQRFGTGSAQAPFNPLVVT